MPYQLKRFEFLRTGIPSVIHNIDVIEGVGPAFAERLLAAGVLTTTDLLRRCSDSQGRRQVSDETGLSESLIFKWTRLADLMRVAGVGGEDAELLEASGVDDVAQFRARDAENLAVRLRQINEVKKLSLAVPSVDVLERWIQRAGMLEPMIRR